MHRFEALFRRQIHKYASVQIIANVAFIAVLCLAHPDPQLSEASEEAKARPGSTAFPGSRDCPGNQAAPV